MPDSNQEQWHHLYGTGITQKTKCIISLWHLMICYQRKRLPVSSILASFLLISIRENFSIQKWVKIDCFLNHFSTIFTYLRCLIRNGWNFINFLVETMESRTIAIPNNLLTGDSINSFCFTGFEWILFGWKWLVDMWVTCLITYPIRDPWRSFQT